MIKFDQVQKSYPTGDTVLDKASFVIEPGELVIVKGPSGSGKTTLLRLIYKDLEPTHGTITVNNYDLTSLDNKLLPEYRRSVGFAFQDFKIIPDLTVWENISLALEIMDVDEKTTNERVSHLLELIGLENKASLFPSQLSGGEVQRVSIARAIASEPEILLADEPTGNLDLETTLQIADLLSQIHSIGTTVILATHDNDIIKHLKTRELELEKGKLKSDTGKSKVASKKEADKEDEKPEEPQVEPPEEKKESSKHKK